MKIEKLWGQNIWKLKDTEVAFEICQPMLYQIDGSDPADAQFEWNATYGHFISWSNEDFRIRELKEPVISHGEKIYWSLLICRRPPRNQSRFRSQQEI
jgi:hypothetical protein